MGLKITTSKLQRFAFATVLIWMIAQIIVIVYRWDAPMFSDAANYAQFAYESYGLSSWYPTYEQMHNNAWIANTGYINFLILNLYVFGSLKFVAFQQLALNCLLLFCIYKLAIKFGGNATGCFAIILFCILPSNLFNTSPLMSDLMCMSLLFASILILRRNFLCLFLAGMVAAIANWVRPIGIIYWPSIFIISLILLHNKVSVRRYALYAIVYISGILVVNSCISALTYHTSGVALSGSTTKGTNMIIGCNNNSDGGYSDEVFQPGMPGYIPQGELNAVERDKELTRRSVQWIINHPVKFISLIPAKIFRLWCGDYYNNTIYQATKEKNSMSTIFLWSLTYYMILLFALIGIWKLRKDFWGINAAILLPVILGTGMHFLMYGGMRYHYPMMPPLIFFAAVALQSVCNIPTTKLYKSCCHLRS